MSVIFNLMVAGVLGAIGGETPTLVQSTLISVGDDPNIVMASDLDGNGKADILVSGHGSRTLRIFYNVADAGFANPQTISHAMNVSEFVVSDMNRDTLPDILFADHESSQFTIWYNGEKGFSTKDSVVVQVETLPHVHTLGVGDFNRDSWPDVVIDSWEDNTLKIYSGVDGKHFSAQPQSVSVAAQPRTNLMVADVNADGYPDIVTPATRHSALSLVMGNRIQEPLMLPVASSPFSVEVADVNGDGRLDILSVHRGGNFRDGQDDALSLLLNEGTGQFTAPPQFPMPLSGAPTAVAVGDVDADGIPEIVVANYRSNSVGLLARSANNDRYHFQEFPVGQGPSSIEVVDIDGDGKKEVLVANREEGSLSILSFTAATP